MLSPFLFEHHGYKALGVVPERSCAFLRAIVYEALLRGGGRCLEYLEECNFRPWTK